MANALTRMWDRVKRKDTALTFPGFGGGSQQGFSSLFTQLLNGAFSGSRNNYAALVGDPSLSSLVMAASGWVGRRLPEARLQVVATDGEDNDEPIPDHPLTELLNRPNPYYDYACLWEQFAFSWILDGNVYWLLRRDSRGRVVEIWPLPHYLVWPRWRNESEYIGAYEYGPNGKSVLYAPQDILHFRTGVSDPENTRKGMSPLRSVLREVYSDGELANFSANLIKNSGVPPLLVTTKESLSSLTPEIMKEFKADLQRRIGGDERGKVLALSHPMEVKQLAFEPDKMDLRKLRFMSEERFCSVIGINPIVLNLGAGSEKSIYNNVESARRSATEDYLCPLWTRIAGTLEHSLLPSLQRSATEKVHVTFDLTSVTALQEKENEKHDRVRGDVLAGILKVKDAQMLLGWIPDDDMDCYLRPSSVVEVRDGEVVTPEPAEPPMPEEEQEQEPIEDAETPADDVDVEELPDENVKAVSSKLLDAAVPWLLSIDEPEIAEMLDAIPVESVD